MLSFVRAVVSSLTAGIHSGHYTVADAFKRILPKARSLAATIGKLSDAPSYRVGHTMLSSTRPDLPYDTLVTHLADNSSTEVKCYTTGMVNVGVYNDDIAFRFKYLVSPFDTV